MIVNVTVSPTAPASNRVIAAAVSILTTGDRARIAGQEVSRAGKGKYLVNGRDAGPGRFAVQVIESLAAAQDATEAVLRAARAESAALQAAFAIRRLALPTGDVLETAALADPGLRTLTPALLAAIVADPACTVVGVPCLLNVGDFMVNARIVGSESRPDPRLESKYGPELYPGVLMIRESTGVEMWTKTSRRAVMVAGSLTAAYDAAKPDRSASKAEAGLARLSAQAARAAADLQAAQRKAQGAAEALLQASHSATANLG